MKQTSFKISSRINFRSQALIFNASFDHKYESILRITLSLKGSRKFLKINFSQIMNSNFALSACLYFDFE